MQYAIIIVVIILCWYFVYQHINYLHFKKLYRNHISDNDFVSDFQEKYPIYQARDIIIARKEVANYIAISPLCLAFNTILPKNHVGIASLIDDLLYNAEELEMETLSSFRKLDMNTVGDMVYLYLKYVLIPNKSTNIEKLLNKTPIITLALSKN